METPTVALLVAAIVSAVLSGVDVWQTQGKSFTAIGLLIASIGLILFILL